ncbi:MAG: beta-N-acetylhexosaminidase [Acidobacteriota bacterium]|nr:beta-N-acetylhexosaminidase [Acidobacteriota bacterium]
MKFRQATFATLIFILMILPSSPVRAQALHLIPQPRQIKTQSGEFLLTPKTEIVITRAHVQQDRLAAQILAAEIERLTGRKPRIRSEQSLPRSGRVIFLGRAGEEDRNLESLLEKQGLSISPNFSGQGYVLDAAPARIVIAARTAQGVFYGVQTLRQLLRPDPEGRPSCPAVSIRDWPAMTWRGVQDDISRGPIPTLDYLESQIRTISAYKINLLGLYMENVFDFQSEPLVAPKGPSLTAAEIKQIVAYGRQYHVTILPEQEAFGHLHKLLRLETYNNLAEIPHGDVLTPLQPGSFALIHSLLTELVPLFPGPFFHIGADETTQLGLGQTQALAEKEGIGRVYIDFLKRVDAILSPYHKKILFWGDIAVKHPELLNLLPKDMIAVAWDYSPADTFVPLLAPYKKSGIPTWVSPGAGNWKRVFPDLDSAFVNIRNFTRDGQKLGSEGMLNTTWNDDGESLIDMTWPAIVFGAACSWQRGQSSIDDFWANYDWAFYRAPGHAFAGAIQKLAQVNDLLDDAGFGGANDQDFWLDPFTPSGARFAVETRSQVQQVRLDAEGALATFYAKRATAHLHAETLDDLIFAARRLDALGMKIQYTAEIDSLYRDAYLHMVNSSQVYRDLYRITSTNGRLEDLRNETTELEADYADLWRRQYHPFWLGNVLIRYNNLASLYQAKIQSLQIVIHEYGRTAEIPPPESFGFVFSEVAEKAAEP